MGGPEAGDLPARETIPDLPDSSLQEVDPQSYRSRDIHGMAGDFSVSLHGVHVTEINSGARYFDRSYHNGPGPNRVDIHMAVGFEL